MSNTFFVNPSLVASVNGMTGNVVVGSQHRYTVRWNQKENTMTRENDAAGITTNTKNFGHLGSVNPDYDNPFDRIYPWSGRKLCNIDIDVYMDLTAGDSLRDCVVAWEGDPDFDYEHKYGVWVYTPEFWGQDYIDGNDRLFEVSDMDMPGFIHYPEDIGGRWHGVKTNLTVGGEAKDVFLPLANEPFAGEYQNTQMHEQAKNYGATLDSIYIKDKDTLLYLVEYACTNSQNVLGRGVAVLHQGNNSHPIEDVISSNTVKVNTSDAGIIAPNQIFSIGDANDRGLVNRAVVVSKGADDAGVTTVTLDRKVSITKKQFWSIHGMANTPDMEIGSRSGYIGDNGKSIAYYRGKELYGNATFYILGAYRQQNTNHIWIAKDVYDADEVDELDVDKHIDTGVVLAHTLDDLTNGYLNTLGRCKGLSAPPFCTAVGGSTEKPIGDFYWNEKPSYKNTVLQTGGASHNDAGCGIFASGWNNAPDGLYYRYSARPVLLPPG